MKVDSTTNKFSFATMIDPDDDLLAMAGMGLLGSGEDTSQNSGNRAEMRKVILLHFSGLRETLCAFSHAELWSKLILILMNYFY